MRKCAVRVVLAWWVCCGMAVAWSAGADDVPPANIVLIMADDLGYECIGANGGAYATPNLDALAAGGVRFTNCFANPLCTPSRVKIMTGLYNVRNYVKFGVLPRGEVTFAHRLKRAGYATAVAGKWQLGDKVDSPRHFGFDTSCLWQHTRKRTRAGTRIDSRFPNPLLEIDGNERDFTDGEYGPQVCADFICDFMETNRDRPFLVYYPMILTHCPFVPTPDSKDWDPTDPGSKTYKGDAKHFADMVTYMDKLVGQIVDKLEALGLRENTLILFTGDNGTDQPIVTRMNGRAIEWGKGKLNDAGTRVPLIASWPRLHAAGRVSETLVDFTDILPTLCEASGAALPEGYPGDGVSLIPAITGAGERDKPWVYVWYRGQVMARNETYALVGSQSGAEMRLLKYARPYDAETLADADLTPQEVKTKAALQAVIDRLAATRPAELRAQTGGK
ncbi:MAG: sulfatase-like hydrolase/transferase [Phycisphaeraceae bacterium]